MKYQQTLDKNSQKMIGKIFLNEKNMGEFNEYLISRSDWVLSETSCYLS
jgi:hypothetical protein